MEKGSFKAEWSNIDVASDPGYFVHFMDTVMGRNADSPQQYRTIFDLLSIKEDDYIIDVGCGLGGSVRAAAKLARGRGRFVGVDNSAIMVAEARQRSLSTNLPVEFEKADAHSLPFPDNTFDGCFSRGVFEIIQDPRKVLAEMIRVAKPGGRIVVSAPDAETWAIDASAKVLTRKIIEFVSDHETNGWIGRQLLYLFHELGLRDNIVVPNTSVTNDYTLMRCWLEPYVKAAQAAGAVSASEAATWLNDLEHRNRGGRFFSALTTFVVCGTKL